MHRLCGTLTTTAVALVGAAVLGGWAGPGGPVSALSRHGPAGVQLPAAAAAGRPGLISSSATGAGTSGAQARYDTDLAASEAYAEQLVHRAQPPLGAVALSGPPKGQEVAEAVGAPAVSNLVQRTSYWSLPLSESSAFAWLEALEPPAGLRAWSSAQGTGGDGVGYSGPSTAWWEASYLELSAVAAGAGHSYLRADGLVVPWDPRPLVDDAAGPRLRATVAGGCPGSDQGAVGVSNPGRHLSAQLLPPGSPVAVLVCTYGGLPVAMPVPVGPRVPPVGAPVPVAGVARLGQAEPAGSHAAAGAAVAPVAVVQPVSSLPRGTLPPVPAPFRLVRSTLLGPAAGAALASALHRASLVHTDGVMNCPIQGWGALLVVVAYRSGPDVDLWTRGDIGGCGAVSNGWVRTGANPSLRSLQLLLAPYMASYRRCGLLPQALGAQGSPARSAQLQQVDHEHQCVVGGDPRAR